MSFPVHQPLSLTTPDGAILSGFVVGTGSLPLLMIPGAGDGLTTAKESARRLIVQFKARLEDYKILYLSRREPIPQGFTTDQMGEDYAWALAELGWGPTYVECNSGGGPIGQWLAAKRPELVMGLILSCTLHRTDVQTREVISEWYELARRGHWQAFSWSNIQKSFTPDTVRRYRVVRALMDFAKPDNPERILRLFDGLLDLDNSEMLREIRVPTLVIGGEDDQVTPAAVQREMAALIPGAELKLYPGYGHGNDLENPDYLPEILQFIRNLEIRETMLRPSRPSGSGSAVRASPQP